MPFDMEMDEYHEDIKMRNDNMKNILITGVSSGLGEALMEEYIKQGDQVYGISRTSVDRCKHVTCDLAEVGVIHQKLYELLNDITELDVVILNAGLLGDIKTFDNWHQDEINQIMNVNVWSNKYILDWLFRNNKKVKQVITISSGASEHTYKGWGGYSISKAALRMLTEVYSKEVEDTHFMSLAPGLVDTSMQDYLCTQVNETEFPVIKKFKTSKKEKPLKIAKNIIKLLPKLKEYDNGSFIDLRKIK